MTEKERYDWDLNGIWDYNDESDEYIESYEDITKLLNEQEKRINKLEKCREELFIRERDIKNEWRELKERNQRQYERLKQLTDLMQKKDWKALEKIVDDWEKADKLLQAEWRAYD